MTTKRKSGAVANKKITEFCLIPSSNVTSNHTFESYFQSLQSQILNNGTTCQQQLPFSFLAETKLSFFT